MVASLGFVPVAEGATGASKLEVRDGTLTLVKAPGEATNITLEYSPGPQRADGYTNPKDAFEPFSPTRNGWPGLTPAPGAGCAAEPGDELDCTGVRAIDLAGGDETELMEVIATQSVAVRLAGNGGRDGLFADTGADAQLDGGAGDDAIALSRGTATGGPGDDLIDVFPVDADPRSARFAPVRVDCGPGSDLLAYYSARNRQPLPVTVDRASCPPLITPLRRYFPQFPGDYRLVKLPASMRLRMTILRTPEALRGRVAPEKGRPACFRPKRFKVGAGKTLRVKLRLTGEAVRRSRSNSRQTSLCTATMTATDPQGDRVVEYLPFLIRPRDGGTPPPRGGRPG